MLLFTYSDESQPLNTSYAVFNDSLTLFTGWHYFIPTFDPTTPVQEPQVSPEELIRSWGPYPKFVSVTFKTHA